MNILETWKTFKIVPVVVLRDAMDAVDTARALSEGGLPVAEVTFRTEAAEEAIRRMTEAFPDMLVGAGTVCSVEQAKKAVRAGARFVVTPGFSREVSDYVKEQEIPVVPGACTPTELMRVMECGLTCAKFFPASAFGGIGTIKALAGPFPAMKFMPTGGVGQDNIMEYLRLPQVIACGGSWMVKEAYIKEGRFDEIRRLVREAVELVRGQQEG